MRGGCADGRGEDFWDGHEAPDEFLPVPEGRFEGGFRGPDGQVRTGGIGPWRRVVGVRRGTSAVVVAGVDPVLRAIRHVEHRGPAPGRDPGPRGQHDRATRGLAVPPAGAILSRSRPEGRPAAGGRCPPGARGPPNRGHGARSDWAIRRCHSSSATRICIRGRESRRARTPPGRRSGAVPSRPPGSPPGRRSAGVSFRAPGPASATKGRRRREGGGEGGGGGEGEGGEGEGRDWGRWGEGERGGGGGRAERRGRGGRERRGRRGRREGEEGGGKGGRRGGGEGGGEGERREGGGGKGEGRREAIGGGCKGDGRAGGEGEVADSTRGEGKP